MATVINHVRVPAAGLPLPISQSWHFCPRLGGNCSTQRLKHRKRVPRAPSKVCWHSASRARDDAGIHRLPVSAASELRSRVITPISKVTSANTHFEGLPSTRKVVVLIIETQCKNDTEAPIRVAYNKLIARRIIAKREIKCNPDEYNFNVKCCKKCQRGFVKNIECPEDISEHCVPCEDGKEYMDHVNILDECWRCRSCDSILGLELVKNCTPEQDTECTCVKNYFCNSAPCRHCDPCTICESGVVEKQCTSTSDTVCGMKEGLPQWAIALITVLLLSAAIGAIIYYKRRQKGLTSKEILCEEVPKPEVSYENVPLIGTDVDLSSHIAGIVEEMTLQEVKTFVRNHKVPEPVIDQILRDYISDTSEQKIKLFQAWYQRHGIKGAYGTLISSLREFKMCAAADKIEEKLKAAVSSCQEGGQSYSDDTEQSKTCTQEGRNSYNDSAELSKTCSGSLEET
ncbi:tumor necrosis factor receptor superfamily member 6 [Egretta garzetta]|uniref:tumor necrosis factor receptor superfamily member 6 n=1 Tax=Egretta garzetta TaxID=188379 RepID=UPI00163C5C92|nr:tumor necrosis factor receptor superfamily member 6 [Egretta garzetta]